MQVESSGAAEPVAAWQPFTFAGAARFAEAPFGRLWLVQAVVGLAAGIVCLVAVRLAWVPEIEEALKNLPTAGAIRGGTLVWLADSTNLVSGKFLAIRVDPLSRWRLGQESDVGIEFGKREAKVSSVLGSWKFAYPEAFVIPLNSLELGPWWGAWKPALLAGGALLVPGILMVIWNALAFLLAAPAIFSARLGRRAGGFKEAWKTCGAGMLMGAVLMSISVVLYAIQRISLIGWLAAVAAHFVIGILYAIAAPWFWPRRAAIPKRNKNPFAAAPSGF